MSYNGSGTFNINTAGQPVVTGTVISSTAFNALTADLGTGLSTALTKDGQTIATARIPFAQGINSSLVTDATSTTTGSIITAGGMGIAKALYVGTTANIAGTTTLAGVTATSVTDSGLTSGRVTYATTGGLLTDSAGLTFDGTMLSSAVARFGTYASFGTESLQVAKANGTGSVGSAYQFAINSKTANNRAEMIMTDGVSANAFISYAPSATTANDKLTFNLQGSDIITVVGNSRVGISTTSPIAKLDVGGGLTDTVPATYGGTIRVNSSTQTTVQAIGGIEFPVASDGYGYKLQQISNSGANLVFASRYGSATWTERMRLDSSGIVTMSAYGAGAATFSASGVISSVSDETWKIKDGAPVDPDSMLNKLEPGYWYYNDEKKDIFGKDRQLGFYAQNVNAAIGPEAAPEPENNKPWGYYDRSVLAVTVMSLQKALKTIESLTNRLTALENK